MTVELSPEDAILFVEFQKNYKKFQEFDEFYEIHTTMKKAGVFDIKNGKAILNFNRFGQLADIELQYHTYKVA
jgi:hypothetical protein